MLKRSLPTQFYLLLAFLLLFSFGLHIWILSYKDLPIFDNLIIRSYLVNALLAATIFFLLYQYRKRLKSQMGFLFMGGSFLKFIFFFLLFYPTYKSDGEMSGLEFASFFVPYLVCLFLETFFTSKMLKNLDESTK
ncbi:DUF6168 family protein [Flagellimonas eckloniae]|uniref:Uncharacterized protein n=1 Tax=Flagellimonas eckloniae TaxID=346185 RepID=A0A0Q0XNF1_9FLAO|nr:DUF6168 family protein [Allomuricauda eckloniae]KQC30574.1 hypothetical protein AAY42_12340 [Allomuricauda eckloniae]